MHSPFYAPGGHHNVAAAAAPDMYAGLSDAAAGDSIHHFTGLAQLLLIGLLAFPIWLFGVLIGLLLPKGFSDSGAEQVAAAASSSAAADDDVSIASLSSAASAQGGISSRPLSDGELESSTHVASDDEDDVFDEQQQRVVRIDNATGAAAAGASSRWGVSWKHMVPDFWGQQQRQGQQQTHLAAAPAGPSPPATPTLGSSAATAVKPGAADTTSSSDRRHQRGRHHKHHKHQQHQQQQHQHGSRSDQAVPPAAAAAAAGPGHRWFVGQSDLDKFHDTLAPVEARLMSGNLSPGWTLIMDKEVPGVVRYLSYWRPTDNGTTDYLSVTIIPDTTAQEVHEFNLDDACRCKWDPMLKSTWLIGSRDTSAAEQLVVWLRSFPFGFLSDRIYAGIARRGFRDASDPNVLYGVTKVVETASTTAWAAEHFPGVVQTSNYFSAWRCRTITSPWSTSSSNDTAASPASRSDPTLPSPTINTGKPSSSSSSSSQPACELILLHHDELKVPEYLSRMAIKLGMWKFVQGMVDAAGTWLEQRREHADPFQDDPQAACRQQAPPLTGTAAAAAAAAADSALGSGEAHPGGYEPDYEAALLSPRRLYAVPTAPLPLSGLTHRDSTNSLAGDLAGTSSDAAGGRITRGGSQHRRGHSMEWEPLASGSSTALTAGGGQGAAPAAGTHPAAASATCAAKGPLTVRTGTTASPAEKQQQQQQVHVWGLPLPNLPRLQLGLGFNPVHAVMGLPGAVQHTLGGLISSLRGGGNSQGPNGKGSAAGAGFAGDASPYGADGDSGGRGADVAARLSTGDQDSSRGKQVAGVKGGGPFAGAALHGAAPAGDWHYNSDDVRCDAGGMNGADQRSKETAGAAGATHSRPLSRDSRGGRRGVTGLMRQVLVRGVAVVAAVAIGGMLAGFTDGVELPLASRTNKKRGSRGGSFVAD